MTFPAVLVVLGDATSSKQWREDFRGAMKKFDEEHEWRPRMVNGIDCGDWVRKDGRPFSIYED